MVEKGFLITTAQRNEKGEQVDAEQKRVERIIETKMPVALQAPSEPGKAPQDLGKTVEEYTGGAASQFKMPQTVNVVGNAIEFASGMRNRCGLCLNFSNKAFMEWKNRAMWAPKGSELRTAYDGLLGQILQREPEINANDEHTGRDNDFDADHALNCCGICLELSAIFKDECIMWPDSGCPDYRTNDLIEPEFRVDFGHLFKPRDRDAVSTGNAAYDHILKIAQGTPTRRAKRFK
jgi:hypothetical protein